MTDWLLIIYYLMKIWILIFEVIAALADMLDG
jgi:hypothetical protein